MEQFCVSNRDTIRNLRLAIESELPRDDFDNLDDYDYHIAVIIHDEFEHEDLNFDKLDFIFHLMIWNRMERYEKVGLGNITQSGQFNFSERGLIKFGLDI